MQSTPVTLQSEIRDKTVKGKGVYSLWTPWQSHGASPSIWDQCYLPPDTSEHAPL